LKPFNLYARATDLNPFPAYQTLRDEFPCYWLEDANSWILTRHEDVTKAAVDWETYSSLCGNLIDEIPDRPGGSLGTTDPPQHDRLRSLVQSAFSRKKIETLAPLVRDFARNAINEFKTDEDIDFVSQFSAQVTVRSILTLLGLPISDVVELRNDVMLSISTDKEKKGRNEHLDAAFSRVRAFVSKEVARRREKPADDMITRLTLAEQDGDQLTEREVILTATMFVIAGVESLSGLLSMMAINLATMPELRHALARNPSDIPQFIEETLRFNPPAQRFQRILTRDVKIHGQEMKKGDRVILAFGSANRDERKFPNACEFDMNRKITGHLGLGAGKHFCIGNILGRMVAQTVFEEFLNLKPDFELATADIDWISSSNFRAPNSLYLKFTHGR
jgi:cytochrome P450